MLVFTISLIVAFHLVSCQKSPTKIREDKSEASAPDFDNGRDNSKPNDGFSLYIPEENDIVKLRSYILSKRLERTTKSAADYGVGFHALSPYTSLIEENLDQDFFSALTGGEYSKIDTLIQSYMALLPQDPAEKPSPRVIARLGFLNVWKFSERMRLLSPSASFDSQTIMNLSQSLGACAEYFSKASELDLYSSVYRGFAATCNLAMGQTPGGEKYTMNGLLAAARAIRRNPEFNLFTVAYVLTSLPVSRPEFGLGLEMLWKNLDACFSTQVNRTNPDLSRILKDFLPTGNKNFCLNSKVSPHNFEGFFLIFGDILIKAGSPQVAKIMYSNAKLLPSFHSWPMKSTLNDRLANADNLVQAFQIAVNPFSKPIHETIVFNTEKSCMVCHQK